MKKKIETSKSILLTSYIVAITLTIIVIFGSFLEYDMSNITTITALAYAELGTANAFYLNKAAKENVLKIAKNVPQEYKEQVDINQLLNQ